MKKIVFCDLDDSLMIDGKLNKEVMYLYNNLDKATWIINTGRSCHMAAHILSYLNFPTSGIIGLNGNQLTTDKGILSLKKFEKGFVKQIVDFCKNSEAIVNFYSSEYDYYLSFKDKIELCINHAKKEKNTEKEILIEALHYYISHFDGFLEYREKKNIDIFKLTIVESEKKLIQNCRQLETEKHCEFLFLNNCIELLPVGINKGTGVQKYFELNKIKHGDYLIIAIGDADNDETMFKQSDLCIASQKGTEVIKDRSNFIIGTENIEKIAKEINNTKNIK